MTPHGVAVVAEGLAVVADVVDRVCARCSGCRRRPLVVISPATMARPVVTSVSQATRLCGSSASMASRIESEIWSAILSGWPSVTDSEVKVNLLTGAPWSGVWRSVRAWRGGRPRHRGRHGRPPACRVRATSLSIPAGDDDHAPRWCRARTRRRAAETSLATMRSTALAGQLGRGVGVARRRSRPRSRRGSDRAGLRWTEVAEDVVGRLERDRGGAALLLQLGDRRRCRVGSRPRRRP